LALLVTRGGPTMLVYRKDLAYKPRLAMALFTSPPFPMLVALTQVALDDGSMKPNVAAALVGAGALSVLIFPVVAIGIYRSTEAPREPSGESDVAAR